MFSIYNNNFKFLTCFYGFTIYYLRITHFKKTIQTSYNEKDGNAFRDSTSFEVADACRQQSISLKKNKMDENSFYEIEEEDTKGGGKSSKIQNNETHHLDSSSPVTMIPKYKGDSAALTESNSCSKLIVEDTCLESHQQICSNTSQAE